MKLLLPLHLHWNYLQLILYRKMQVVTFQSIRHLVIIIYLQLKHLPLKMMFFHHKFLLEQRIMALFIPYNLMLEKFKICKIK